MAAETQGTGDIPADLYPSREELALAFEVVRRAQLPHIPDVILKLRSEMAGGDPDSKRIADLIAQDPALAGSLLKTVNSAGLGAVEPIDSVQQAVVRLGLERVSKLVTAESLKVLAAGGGPEVMQIWESMLDEARIAVAIARHTSGVDLEEAYLFSMMHDVAHILFTRIDPGFAGFHDQAGILPLSVLRQERVRIGIDHATVGFLFARHWDLPDYFSLAIYHHHTSQYARFDGPRIRSLIAIIQLAGYLTSQHLRDLELPEMIQYRMAAQRELLLPADVWEQLKRESLSGAAA